MYGHHYKINPDRVVFYPSEIISYAITTGQVEILISLYCRRMDWSDTTDMKFCTDII